MLFKRHKNNNELWCWHNRLAPKFITDVILRFLSMSPNFFDLIINSTRECGCVYTHLKFESSFVRRFCCYFCFEFDDLGASCFIIRETWFFFVFETQYIETNNIKLMKEKSEATEKFCIITSFHWQIVVFGVLRGVWTGTNQWIRANKQLSWKVSIL